MCQGVMSLPGDPDPHVQIFLRNKPGIMGSSGQWVVVSGLQSAVNGHHDISYTALMIFSPIIADISAFIYKLVADSVRVGLWLDVRAGALWAASLVVTASAVDTL